MPDVGGMKKKMKEDRARKTAKRMPFLTSTYQVATLCAMLVEGKKDEKRQRRKLRMSEIN